MSTIVTATVAYCLDSFNLDRSRYSVIDNRNDEIFLSKRPEDDDVSFLRHQKCYWTAAGLEMDEPVHTLLLDDLHQLDFVCLKPDDKAQKLQQIAQVKEIKLIEGQRHFRLLNYNRKSRHSRQIEPNGEVYELLASDRIENRCYVDTKEAHNAHFITSDVADLCNECATIRKLREQSIRAMHKLKVLSLFGGAGGIDIGLPESSFRTEMMIDSDDASCRTFRRHHPKARVIQGDVGETLQGLMMADDIGRFDVIIMGPPCQSFSKLNRQSRERRALDPRSLCVATGLSFVEIHRPTYGIIENVLGIFENGDLGDVNASGVIKFILQCLATLGYNVRLCELHSNAFGVPQSRTRLVFIFAKTDVTLPPAPVGDYTSRCGPSKFPAISLREAFSDLSQWEWSNPRRYAPDCTLKDTRPEKERPQAFSPNAEGQVDGPFWCKYRSKPRNQFQAWIRRSGNDKVQQHYTLPHIGDPLLTVERVCHIPFRKNANHLDLMPIPSLAVPELMTCLDDTVFQNAFGRLDADDLFPIVTTEINLREKSGRMILPDQNRLPSIRELARVQGFPDGITFCGEPREIVRQIGNAVPGPLAFALGESIVNAVTTDFLNGDRRFARKM